MDRSPVKQSHIPYMPPANRLDAVIVLAGGTAHRLGKVSKPEYRVAGYRLLDLVLGEICAIAPAARIVVVGPPQLSVPPGVILTNEDPPLGGPLAGIAAGVAALGELPADGVLGLATCDAPRAIGCFIPLLARMAGSPQCAGAVPRAQDRIQYVHGVYRWAWIRQAIEKESQVVRNGSIRQAFAQLPLCVVDCDSSDFTDVDTVADAQQLAEQIRRGVYVPRPVK
ncbi:molybdenum cofactor guanylyltransferase [Trueperella sp. LYQ141]|uniref:molybdenum cofactor guanylyltransferase n=1 Tax=Trueperella sp. LYQ141 TaxID=3391058 RepID=UPI003982EE0B